MGIQVLANGTPDFHYIKDAVTIGDVYDAAEVYSFIANTPCEHPRRSEGQDQDARMACRWKPGQVSFCWAIRESHQ